MRRARIKPDSANPEAPGRPAGTYYHLVNRIAGQPGQLPFGDPEKEMLLRLLLRLCLFFIVEPVSCAIMGNHFHLVVFVPALPPLLDEALRRFRAYYGEKRRTTAAERQRLPARLRDLSAFMHLLQFPFTCWFNATRPGGRRRGALWQGRFKSVVLSPEAARRCITYVELNPVRAGIAGHPSDYPFCSFGIWEETGKHPFGKAAIVHLRYLLGTDFKDASATELRRHLRQEFSRIIAGELPLDYLGSEEARRMEHASRPPPAWGRNLMRRALHWTDGVIVGSKAFVTKTAALVRDQLATLHPERHRPTPFDDPPDLEVPAGAGLPSGAITAPAPCFCWQKLRKRPD